MWRIIWRTESHRRTLAAATSKCKGEISFPKTHSGTVIIPDDLVEIMEERRHNRDGETAFLLTTLLVSFVPGTKLSYYFRSLHTNKYNHTLDCSFSCKQCQNHHLFHLITVRGVCNFGLFSFFLLFTCYLSVDTQKCFYLRWFRNW